MPVHRFLSIVCLALLTLAAGGAAESGPNIGDPASISARIDRLEEAGTLDESAAAQLLMARRLLQTATERRTHVDALVAEAEGAGSTVSRLLSDVASERQAVGTVRDKLSSSSDTGTDARLLAVMSERDALDAALSRAHEVAAGLDARGPQILKALEELRGSGMKAGVLDTEARRRSEAEGENKGRGDLVREVLAAARRVELDIMTESLLRELATLTPRSRIAAARLQVLGTRRALLSRSLDRLASDDEKARLATLEAIVPRLESALADTLADTPADAANERSSIERSLEHAHKSLEIVRAAIALRTGDAANQRRRGALLDAEVSTNNVLAAGTLREPQRQLLQKIRREIPSIESLEASLSGVTRASERLRLDRVLREDELRRLGAGPAMPTIDGLPAEIDTLRLLVDTARWRGERLERRVLLLGETLERARTLAGRLDRELLWLRQGERFGATLVPDMLAGAAWLANPASWSSALAEFVKHIRKQPLPIALGLLVIIGLSVSRRLILARQSDLTACVGHVGRDGYWVTPRTILLNVPLALPVPLALGTLAWPLLQGAAVGSFPRALGIGLGMLAAMLFALGVFRRLSRDQGVFVKHFGWSAEAGHALYSHLRMLIGVLVPVTLILAMTLASGSQSIRHGLGLVAFSIGSFALARFVWQLCRPRRGVLAVATGRQRARPFAKLVLIVLIAVPIAVGLLPLAGYFEAAIELQTLVFSTGLILLAGAVLYGVMLRHYAVALRRYALRWARERRQERARLRGAVGGGEAVPTTSSDEMLAPEPLAGQARAALSAIAVLVAASGLWWLWAPLLPALGIADEIVLWNRSANIDGVLVESPVTLWSLLLAITLVVGGVLAARNLRGLLQVGLLQRLDLDPGTRYAVTTITGYVVLGIGLVSGFSQLGIDWSKLQWIVAALGVGLGFGLQEVVANFVSGIIILFERPVRVGDTVTIGELSGTVSDISIRATTVTDFENREVLLPNKSIITENVTNWTLHDAITRLLIRIGVAYGSDVATVRGLLLSVVQSHPDVLHQPTPTVFFTGHGASSLDFEIRIFVATPALRLPVTHDINSGINRALAEAGIGIPFPQTDVHLRVVGDSAQAIDDQEFPVRLAG